jgi:hypothetical protein
MAKNFDPLTMPCLRGNFGNWIYYSCLMSVADLQPAWNTQMTFTLPRNYQI